MKKGKFGLMIILLIAFTALLVGWRYPQAKTTGWDYKIVPISNVAQGEQVLKEMDGQGWEFIAVQPVRTQTEIVPKLHSIQSTSQAPLQPLQNRGAQQPEAMYFFRRAK